MPVRLWLRIFSEEILNQAVRGQTLDERNMLHAGAQSDSVREMVRKLRLEYAGAIYRVTVRPAVSRSR